MIKFEKVNELSLRITADGGESVFTKAGAFICGECFGQKNYQFEKVLLGPQGNPLQAIMGQVLRRFTGENLPLMKVKFGGQSVTYYANEQQHVTVFNLAHNQTLSVESENILAFTSDCKYSVRFLAQGVISQKGLATSTLTGGPNGTSQVAVLCDGNPLVMSNQNSGSTIQVDPDAVVCWEGSDPGFKLDLSWKNLIGQASGESYMFEWSGDKRAVVMIQPQERKSGVNIGMDGGSHGQRAQRQDNQTIREAAGGVGDTLGGVGDMISGLLGSGGSSGRSGTVGGGLGNLF